MTTTNRDIRYGAIATIAIITAIIVAQQMLSRRIDELIRIHRMETESIAGLADSIQALVRVHRESRLETNGTYRTPVTSRPTEAGPGQEGAVPHSELRSDPVAGVPAGSLRLSAQASAPADPEKRKMLHALFAAPRESWSKGHWLLTYADVMEKYGAPDALGRGHKDEIVFTYEIAPATSMFFMFVDGVVIGVH